MHLCSPITRRICSQSIAIGSLLALSACPKPDPEAQGKLSVFISGTPVITRESGKTYIFIDYLVRDANGDPLSREDFRIRTLQDGSPLDVEAIGNESNTPLSSSLNYHLVLDGSYSMLTHFPPAFHPMLDAAGDSIDAIGAEWLSNGGDFFYGITWFDEWIFETNEEWTAGDLASIPKPSSGTATKLFSATDFATRKLQAEFDGGIANGPRDQHIMIVFSDGQDNYSHYDQSGDDPPACTLSESQNYCITETGAEYSIIPSEPTTLDELEARIMAHPNLTVNVLGLGSSVNDGELERIALAGSGQYIHNPDPADVEGLFHSALKQFIDKNTVWYRIPEPDGEYTLSLEFKAADHLDPAEGHCSVTYNTEGSVSEFSCDGG